MAHVVLTAVVSTFLNQSTSPLLEEIFLLYNYKNELRKLEDTVGVIRNVLQDAEERQSYEHLTQGWLSRITVVMYDADDLLDQVVARALQKRAMTGYTFVKEVQLFFSKSNHLAFVLQTSNGVKGIRKSLDNITKDMEQFKFNSITRQLQDRRPLVRADRETHSFVQESVVFGREKEKEDIINMLLSNNIEHQGISVIAIHGFGGLGKTTLAQLVYNDMRVKSEFQLCIWVCINYFTSLEKVLIAIIKSCRKKPTNLGLEQLQQQLRGIISGKRCLLVLDDVWDEDAGHWNSLKPFLNCTRNDSKVLVTTRSEKVYQCLDDFECYELGVLSKESAWRLFEEMYFKEQELVEDPRLKSLGEQIAYKCGYVPLALITIGSLFRENGKVHRRKLSSLNQELSKVVSLGENRMMQTLKISYDDLPSNLKLCFAYCSLFPKDYTFEKDELVRLWLAQGFLEPQACGKTFEGEGEDVFFYLAGRCFFQEIEKQGCSRYLCKMHHLFHDLAKEVSGIEYRVIEEVTDELKGKAFRHISIDCELDSALLNYHRLFSASKALRTLIFSPKSLQTNSLRTLLGRFRMLRTLDLSCMELDKVSKSIGKLIHLRYLNLSENENLKYLPNEICKLLHLQTLNLSWCKSLEKLPSTIGKLARLRYLILNGCENLTFLPPGISALTLLVSLDRLIVHQQDGGLRYLNRLDNLCGNLTIKLPMKGWMNSEQDANRSNMINKDKLNGLTIEWERSEIDSDDQRMPRSEVDEVLRALHLHPHGDLQYLKITECNASKLPTWLSSHQNIEELILQCWHEMEYMEDSIVSVTSFQFLKIITIEDMCNVKGWWREATTVPCFPCVSKVDIRRCPKLSERMPLFRQIEELTLSSVTQEAVEQLLTVSIDNSNRLKKLKLEQIKGLKCMPYEWLRHLTALETLVITSCTELEWVSRGGLRHLTALEELKIEESGKVELVDEYCEMEDEDGLPWEALQRLRVLELPVRDKHFDEGLQYLSALEDLAIYSFQQKEDIHYKGIQYFAAQQGIDIFSWVREEDKKEVNYEIVEEEDEEEEDMMPWRKLERLRKLTVGFDQKPWRFPNDIECLHCLEHLMISDCRELSVSWSVLVKLKRLRSLTFCRVENVILDVVMEAPPINNMTSLKFEECHGELQWMNEMPWNLLPLLHSLAFVYMPDLEHLPDGIQSLKSLQQLEIISCQNLKSLPNWIISLTSLQSLVIAVCSNELNERCVEETGADRPHIRHIPYIHIW